MLKSSNKKLINNWKFLLHAQKNGARFAIGGVKKNPPGTQRVKHYARVYNFSPEQEALHLLLALSQNISDDLLRSVPDYQNMTADQILDAWHRRICPSSVRDIAVAELSRLEQGMNEDNRAYLERAENIYIDAQAVG